jgi:hypothetical protein
MADLCWRVPYDGKEYEFNAHQDLTVGRLRQIKAWFGNELGRWSPFILALGEGDPDAAACVVWICRTKAGEKNVPEPRFMTDFAVGSFLQAMEVDSEDGQEGPTVDDEPEPTKGSKRTSKS